MIFIVLIGSVYFINRNKGDTSGNLIPVTIAAHKIPLASSYIVAKEKGLFEKNGLNANIVYFTTGFESLQALTAGQADIAVTGGTPFVHVSFQRDDIRIINQSGRSNDIQIVARKDAGISSISDLKGKKIGSIKNTVTEIALANAFTNTGITKNDYTQIDFNQPIPLPNVLQAKEVDAYAAWEPFVSNGIKAIGKDNAVVFGSERGLHYLLYLTVVQKSDLESKNEIIKKVTKSLIDAEKFIKKNPEESIEVVSKITGMEKTVLAEIWQKFDFTQSLNADLLTELNTQRDTFRTEKTKFNPDYNKIIETRYLKALSPKAVEI